jgi:dephospho-CoA kinase
MAANSLFNSLNIGLTIGLTGGIGSGKSSVARLFAKHGIEIVDADSIARDVVAVGEPVLSTIADYFGDNALLEDGSLNRAFVRQLTFSDPAKKTWLNATLHPLIRERLLSSMHAASSAYCIVDVPLLTENNMKGLFTRVLVVDCSEALQLERALTRDNSDEKVIKNIIAAQAKREERKAIADDIIENTGTLAELQKQVDKLHAFYCSLLK